MKNRTLVLHSCGYGRFKSGLAKLHCWSNLGPRYAIAKTGKRGDFLSLNQSHVGRYLIPTILKIELTVNSVFRYHNILPTYLSSVLYIFKKVQSSINAGRKRASFLLSKIELAAH